MLLLAALGMAPIHTLADEMPLGMLADKIPVAAIAAIKFRDQ